MVKQYGNWAMLKGTLEDMSDGLIEDAKQLLYETAEEELQVEGVDIKQCDIKWIIRQAYTSSFGPVPEQLTPESEPVVTIGWTCVVKTDE